MFKGLEMLLSMSLSTRHRQRHTNVVSMSCRPIMALSLVSGGKTVFGEFGLVGIVDSVSVLTFSADKVEFLFKTD